MPLTHVPLTQAPVHSASAVHRFGEQPTAGLQTASEPHEVALHFARRQIPVAASHTDGGAEYQTVTSESVCGVWDSAAITF